MKTIPLHPLACLLAALMLAVLCVPMVSADSGDYDEIQSYVITVDPRQDGSADITYQIDWQVVGGGSGDYLSWVNIGLANSYADEIEILTPDTVADVSLVTENGSYAKVTFHDKYYAPDVAAANGGESRVEFAFKVHQSHLFTMNDDDTASFSFTPGWFDEICVQSLTVRWRNYDGFLADNTGTDGDYLTWEFGPLGHGERVNVNVTVPIVTADGYTAENEKTSEDMTAGPVDGTYQEDTSAEDVAAIAITLLVVLLIAFAVSSRSARWHGGMGVDDPAAWIWYSNNLHTIRMRRGAPPPAGYHAVDPPANFRAGGGSTRGGGAGRSDTSHHSGCVCACACVSCACACACAGGGRAGCSVKNFYRIRLPKSALPAKEYDNEH